MLRQVSNTQTARNCYRCKNVNVDVYTMLFGSGMFLKQNSVVPTYCVAATLYSSLGVQESVSFWTELQMEDALLKRS